MTRRRNIPGQTMDRSEISRPLVPTTKKGEPVFRTPNKQPPQFTRDENMTPEELAHKQGYRKL